MPPFSDIRQTVDRLIEAALEAAGQDRLTRDHLDAVADAVRAAGDRDADAAWLREVQERFARLLDLRTRARAARALEADPYGRRKAARITEPPLTVVFPDGTRCDTIDWSSFGVLVPTGPDALAAGAPAAFEVSSPLVEGGGPVSGRVVWRGPSGEMAIEIAPPSVAIQAMKVRMLRAGVLVPR